MEENKNNNTMISFVNKITSIVTLLLSPKTQPPHPHPQSLRPPQPPLPTTQRIMEGYRGQPLPPMLQAPEFPPAMNYEDEIEEVRGKNEEIDGDRGPCQPNLTTTAIPIPNPILLISPPNPLDLDHHGLAAPTVILVLRDAFPPKRYRISKATVDFWAPPLRNMMEEQMDAMMDHDGDFTDVTSINVLHTDDDAFKHVLYFWQHHRLRPELCHRYDDGFPGSQAMHSKDPYAVPIIIKIWALADRLGGPTTALRDICMRHIYADQRSLPIPHCMSAASLRYVLEQHRYDFSSSLLPGKELHRYFESGLTRYLLGLAARHYDHPYNGEDADARVGTAEEWTDLVDEFMPFFRAVESLSKRMALRRDMMGGHEGGNRGPPNRGMSHAEARRMALRREIMGPIQRPPTSLPFSSLDQFEVKGLETYAATLGELTSGWHAKRDQFGRR